MLKNIDMALDTSWLVVAFVLAYYIKRDWLPFGLSGLATQPNYYLVLFISLVTCLPLLHFFSVYEPFRKQTFAIVFTKIFKALCFSIFTISFFLYAFHFEHISRIFLGIFILFSLLLLSISKFVIFTVLKNYRSKDYNRRNVVMIGAGELAVEMIKAIQKNPGSGYRILGCLEPQEKSIEPIGTVVYGEVKIIGTTEKFCQFLLGGAVDEVIIAQSLEKIDNIGELIHFAEQLGVHIRIMPDLKLQDIMFRPETARIYMEQFVGMPTIAISSVSPRGGELMIKIFIDYLCAALGLLLLSPLFALIAVGIAVTSPGPVFFIQERCGLNGRRFKMIKFRTMVSDAESHLRELEKFNDMDGPVFKMVADPRITPFGKILRKTSLDELPQLLNILKGEMSLIGPRPAIPSEVEKYRPWQRRRLSMKPGITCIWQVSGRNTLCFEEWMRLDLQYIDTWSPWLDIKLLFLTFREVIFCNGH